MLRILFLQLMVFNFKFADFLLELSVGLGGLHQDVCIVELSLLNLQELLLQTFNLIEV